MDFLGIIPARYASTRFPGKPLAEINGKPMVQRVYEQSRLALNNVWVATDDDRIRKAVKNFGGNVVMTSANHQSGTDRIAEASNIISNELKLNIDVVINIQGDEPFIQPEQINKIKTCFDTGYAQIATLVKQINNIDEVFDPNKVKAVISADKKAIYFSRSPIPYQRREQKENWLNKAIYYKHIGMYAYKIKTLHEITQLPQSPLELSESLEQLRWIENGYWIQTEITEHESIGIDSPDDLKKIDDLGLFQ